MNLDLSKASGPDCTPDCWKVPSVGPVFRNVGESSTAKIYHPVSLLSVVTKALKNL